jgi:Tn7-like transposition protein D/TniQ
MIGHFPTPHPDELLYSLCARYDGRVGYKNKQAINLELFDKRTSVASIDLPCHLKSLIELLPAGHMLSVDRLIHSHTLFPFYAPFLPMDRSLRIKEEMEGFVGTTIHNHTGTIRSEIRQNMWLRFCPLCAIEDRKEFCECYWHRLHQVPGVMVCPDHNVFLEDSHVQIRNRMNNSVYISAETLAPPISVRPLNPTASEHQIILDVARDVAWLLKQHDLTMGRDQLRGLYIQLLNESGLISWSGKIRRAKLFKKFTSYYSKDVLEAFQITLNSRKFDRWIFCLLKAPNGSLPPLKQLLLIRLLGHSAETFFERSRFAEPFIQAGSVKPFRTAPLTPIKRIQSTKHRLTTPQKEILKQFRKQFLSLLRRHPEASRSQIKLVLFPKGYFWLNKHDNDWLQSRLPPPRQWIGGAKIVDWHSLDQKLVEEIQSAVLRLKDDALHLKRITKTLIVKSMNQFNSIIRHSKLKRLPLTTKLLEQVVETRQDYALRRLGLAEQYYRQEGISPTKNTLLSQAGISSDLRRTPEIQMALETAWLSLQTSEHVSVIKAA